VTPAEARAAYPVLARRAYLNAGTFGPLARATVEAVAARRRADVEAGRGGAPYYEWMTQARARVREAIAAEIGVPPDHVALTRATTESCNVVLNGLGLGPGDEVVTTDVEHFGLLGALACSPARVRVAAVRDLPAEGALEAILGAVGPRTRLLALSHVAWSTGHVLPVEELKRETGLPVLLDGAQSVGAVPVDASAFDFYTVSCQKWLCTPDSLGGLYVAEPEALRVTFPSYFSQVRYEPDGGFEPREGAARFDTGWIAPALLAGAEAALGLHPPWRFARARELAARCRELLAERHDVVTEPEHATLVSFRVGDDAPALVTRLWERGVVVRDLPGLGWLRVSCGYWNDETDLERLLDGLAA
jgi:L-cysteine/cystine lyase